MAEKRTRSAYRNAGSGKHAATSATADVAKNRWSKAWIAAVVLAVALVVALIPQLSFALPVTPSYTWYTSHTEGQPYELAGDSDFVGFINIVNGTADVNNDNTPDPADNFAGDTVKLTNNVSLGNEKINPIGGAATGKTFDGSFDGNNKTVSNFSISVTGATGDLATSEKIGLFGAAGAGSEIKNLNIGTGADITVTITDSSKSARNVGLVVGYTEGVVTNCTTDDGGSITVNYNVDTAATNRFPLENIGGVVGAAPMGVTDCANSAAVTVLYNGNPIDDPDYDGGHGTAGDTSILRTIRNVAGVVGQAGTDTNAGAVVGCSNSGKVDVETTKPRDTVSALIKEYSTGLYVGGIAGYAWGDMSDCDNTGQVYAKHVFSAGGVVGCVRSSYAGNFGIETGTAPTDFYTIENCTNNANVTSQGHGGGIVGIAGAGVDITACFNGSANSNIEIIGENSTKPFPSGIVSETYGVVSYCANFGIVATGIANPDGTHASLGSGYYASGIVGLLANDGDGVGSEVHSCYNAGYVYANGAYRNRALVGDNEGTIHNCVAAADMGTSELCYTEGGTGTLYQCAFVPAGTLKTDGPIDTATYTDIEAGTTALALLNAMAAQDGTWTQYWLTSENNINNGFAALVTQDDAWSTTSLAAATVTLKKNAEYTGTAAIPQATVVLGGKTLVQNVDYKVVPTSSSNTQMSTPYTANIVGIGHYSDTATQLLNYQIGKGDLASCSVAIASEVYDWEAHPASSLVATVTNLGGQVVDPSEYDIAFDATDPDLTSGEAINAHLYTVNITAKSTSTNYTGSTTGEFSVTPVQILWKDDNGDANAAIAHGVSYSGVQKAADGTMQYAADKEYSWTSTNNKTLTDDMLPTFEYTGHDIKPTITSISYKGIDLVEGRDYTTLYYDAFLTGATETHNIGVKGGNDYGYVTARYVYGGNFNRSEVMYFRIVDTAAQNDLANAEIKCPATINFEDGSTYTPVEVWYGGSKLTEGVDYTIAYANNDKVGTASYTITAVAGSEFTGTNTGTFELVAAAAYEFTFTVDAVTQTASITGVNYIGANDTFAMDIPETVEKDGVTYTVTSIADKAFGGSQKEDFAGSDTNTSKRKITSVTIPKTVTSIGQFAFGSGSGNNPMTQLTEVSFADGSALETIGNNAFRKTGITSLTIPASVTDIATDAYRDTALSGGTVTFLSKSPTIPVIDANAFRNVTNVAASGYDTATAAKTFVTDTMGTKGWTWTPLAEDAVLTVKVLGADGSVESTVDLTAADIAAGLVDTSVSGDAMVGQYYKGTDWNVYNATKYITFENALSAAGVTAGTHDLIGVEAADGPGKVSATLADMAKGKFYPNANGDTYTDDDDAYEVPAGIAFEYTKGTGATPAAALTAAEAITPPTTNSNLQLMGIYDGATGGNRFWSGVTTITVQRIKDLSSASIAAIPDQTYTGSAVEPAPVVTLDGVTLVAGTDYDVSYSNNTDIGTATVTVTGKGAYIGTTSSTFGIAVAPTPPAANTVTVYRLYNEALHSEHLFTTSVEETRVLVANHGWIYEGCGWYAPDQGTPVYRLYNPGLGSHLYTTSQGEIDELTANWGWVMDFNGSPAFYSGGSNAIYRLYNPQLFGQHLLTTSQGEYNALTGHDWLQEGHVMDCVQLGDPALPLP